MRDDKHEIEGEGIEGKREQRRRGEEGKGVGGCRRAREGRGEGIVKEGSKRGGGGAQWREWGRGREREVERTYRERSNE